MHMEYSLLQVYCSWQYMLSKIHPIIRRRALSSLLSVRWVVFICLPKTCVKEIVLCGWLSYMLCWALQAFYSYCFLFLENRFYENFWSSYTRHAHTLSNGIIAYGSCTF